MHKSRSKQAVFDSRRGIASLEFVLCLPFLLALAVAIFATSKAMLVKNGVAQQARYQAWKKRGDLAASSRSTPFRTDALGGEISAEPSKQVRKMPVVGGPFTARSG